jgi:hypothetical protein
LPFDKKQGHLRFLGSAALRRRLPQDTVQNLGVVMPLSETDAEPIVLRRHDRDRSRR